MSPMCCSGTLTSRSTIGSSTCGRALRDRVEERLLAGGDERDFLAVDRDGACRRRRSRARPASDSRRSRRRCSTWRTPFSTAGRNCPGIVPPLTSSTNSKPLPRGSGSMRRNTSPNWPGAAGLLLVAMMAFGLGADGFAIGDARRARSRLRRRSVSFSRSSMTRRCRSDRPRITVSLVSVSCSTWKQGSSSASLCSAVASFCSWPLRAASIARPNIGFGKCERREVDLVLVVAVVQHRVEMQVVDLGDRGDVARDRLRDLDVVLALELEQVRDLERLLAVVDEQLRVLLHRALVDAEDAELADERIVDDLEHVGDDVRLRIGLGLDRRGARRRCP